MECSQENIETVCTIGDLVEALYNEVAVLPLSDTAKSALVTIMLGDILKQDGQVIYFQYPAGIQKGEVAA